MTEQDVQDLMREMMRERVSWIRQTTRQLLPPLEERDESRIDQLAQRVNDLTRAIQRNWLGGEDKILKESNVILEERGLVPVDNIDLSNLVTTSLARLQRDVKAIEYHRLRGEHDQEQAILKDYSLADAPAAVMASPAPVVEAKPKTPLKDIIEGYCSENIRTGAWKATSAKDLTQCLQKFLNIVGEDIAIEDLSHETLRGYVSTLSKLPRHMNTKAIYKSKSIPEILKLEIPSHERLTISTVNNSLNNISTFLNHCKRQGMLEVNYAEGKEVRGPKIGGTEREPFTKEHLFKLFHDNKYLEDKHLKPYMHFLPAMALYTGARLKELCQLYLDDIKQENGIYYLDIHQDRPLMSVKSNAAVRKVPLHPFLVDKLKIPAYAEALKKAGEQRLFPELSYMNNSYGQYASKWFKRYMDGCDLKPMKAGNKLSFHSFRSTFINACKQADAPVLKIKEVVGHEIADITMGDYPGRYDLGIAYRDVVLKVDFGVSLDHLADSRFVVEL